MKKSIIFASMLALAAPFVLGSCGDPESEGLSRITTYAVLELNGDDFVKINVGDSYDDPGCVATMGSEDVSSQIVVTSDLDNTTPGFYKVNYVVYNEDGFPATASRDIMVVDPDNFASAYLAQTAYYVGAPITITQYADDVYVIDDINAGYYFYYRYPGYEPTYDFHLETAIKLNADNTLEHVGTAGSWYFSSNVTLVNGSYDPATGTVNYTASNGLTVTLTK